MQGLKIAGYKAGLNALYLSGAHRYVSPRTQGRGAILMFHQVRARPPGRFHPNAHLEVTPQFLDVVVRRVRAAGMEIVDLDEAARRMAGPDDGGRFVVLTFDDGYRNNLTEAYPLLRELGAPFTVYLASGFADRTAVPWWDLLVALVRHVSQLSMQVGDQAIELPSRSLGQKRAACRIAATALCRVDEDEQRRAIESVARAHGIDPVELVAREMMGWGEVRTLAQDPLVTIGAHTVGHYALARLDAARARREMAESRDRIAEMTGSRPRHLAYPYGSQRSASEREFALAAELGFTTAVTTRRGVLTPDSRILALPRISMNGHFQHARYVDLLLSGVPLALEGPLRRLLRGSLSPSGTRASAST
ncbi:polysaccharide deacetylase family protein [Kaistia adipata]|uniref:polysaccharide deacetylase family protein n=1 Tax=Kaistia adipata TaxID=166954 RepID=UPI0004010AA0|nr:polysaccharide deacetylase family protein [Kaistia adipata]